MFIKNKCYNLIILFAYLILCFIIFDTNKISKVNTPIKRPGAIPIEKDIIGNITIDKINLKKPLYKIESAKNQVDQNVTILKESTFPDKEESTLFIAAHSGSSSISYFEQLDELNKNDIIKIMYLNETYFYKVTSIWEEKKNGFIHVKKDNKKQLILTTCSPDHKGRQLVVSSELIKK